MGKIWLKSVDPSRQCCACEGKSGPCSSCCLPISGYADSDILYSAVGFPDNTLLYRQTDLVVPTVYRPSINTIDISTIGPLINTRFGLILNVGDRIDMTASTPANPISTNYPGDCQDGFKGKVIGANIIAQPILTNMYFTGLAGGLPYNQSSPTIFFEQSSVDGYHLYTIDGSCNRQFGVYPDNSAGYLSSIGLADNNRYGFGYFSLSHTAKQQYTHSVGNLGFGLSWGDSIEYNGFTGPPDIIGDMTCPQYYAVGTATFGCPFTTFPAPVVNYVPRSYTPTVGSMTQSLSVRISQLYDTTTLTNKNSSCNLITIVDCGTLSLYDSNDNPVDLNTRFIRVGMNT